MHEKFLKQNPSEQASVCHTNFNGRIVLKMSIEQEQKSIAVTCICKTDKSIACTYADTTETWTRLYLRPARWVADHTFAQLLKGICRSRASNIDIDIPMRHINAEPLKSLLRALHYYAEELLSLHVMWSDAATQIQHLSHMTLKDLLEVSGGV